MFAMRPLFNRVNLDRRSGVEISRIGGKLRLEVYSMDSREMSQVNLMTFTKESAFPRRSKAVASVVLRVADKCLFSEKEFTKPTSPFTG